MSRIFLGIALMLLLGSGAAIVLKSVVTEPRNACGSGYTIESGDKILIPCLEDAQAETHGDALAHAS